MTLTVRNMNNIVKNTKYAISGRPRSPLVKISYLEVSEIQLRNFAMSPPISVANVPASQKASNATKLIIAEITWFSVMAEANIPTEINAAPSKPLQAEQ